MRKFLYKILIFLIPILVYIGIEGFLPINFFTYRPWEALRFISNPDYVFYPNMCLKMTSVGGLCYYTENAIPREENWKTDKIGFRNDTFIKKPDIIIIGDSYIAGSALPEKYIISNTMMRIFKKRITVYSFAPSTFDNFVRLLELGVIKKPKLIVFSIVERNTPLILNKDSVVNNLGKFDYKVTDFEIFMDKIKRKYSANYIRSRLIGKVGAGVKGTNESGMYFYKGANQIYDKDYAIKTLKAIKSYKAYCDSIGVEFLFLPMPDKETVYYDYVPLKEQPGKLLKLDSLLESSGIMAINTLCLYNQYRKNHKELLYYRDDSHWNPKGVELVAHEVCRKYLQMNNFAIAKNMDTTLTGASSNLNCESGR